MTTTTTVSSSSVFFYQQRGYIRHIRRFKKQPDQLPHSLRNYLNPKANIFKRGKGDGDDGTLSSRLAELALFGDESSDSYPPGTASTNKRQRSLLSGQTRSSTAGNPYAFTDTRLNAMRQLTESLIHELQEYLNRFLDADMRPVLGGTIIYDLHADWSDLTENCTYDEFPQWRTKHGRDLLNKPSHKKNIIDDDAASVASSNGIESRANSGLGVHNNNNNTNNNNNNNNNNTNNQHTNINSTSSRVSIITSTSKKSTDKPHRQTTFVPPRLDPITEEKNPKRNSVISMNEGDTSNTQSVTPSRNEHKSSTIQFSTINEVVPPPNIQQRRSSQLGRKLSILKPNGSAGSLLQNLNQNISQVISQQSQQSHQSFIENSRLTTNSSVLSGWAVTFNLSNSLYEEKGWTIVTERIDNQPIDLERRALRSLNKSIYSIEENRIKNERFGLIKLCKIRFYGDHKREQLEKYKLTNLKPKKSNFVMAIQRKEIPKTLDYDTIIETLYPMTNSLISTFNSSSTFSLGNISNDGSTSASIPAVRTICSSHTNDGTIVVYYPSGRIAITCATVFGYYPENSNSSSTFINSSLINNLSTNINSKEISNTSSSNLQNSNLNLTQQQNSNSNNNSLNNQSISINNQTSNKNEATNSNNTTLNTINLPSQIIKDAYTTLIYDDIKPRSEFPITTQTTTASRSIKSPSSTEGRLLAVITSTGYCACFRPNGVLRFVCSEKAGYLCNDKGFATFQWRWDENKAFYSNRIKDGLKVKLNEFISLEYNDPYNIYLKFECQKEVFEFNLGINKDTVQKISEFLNKIASDTPLTSKAASHKLQKAIKNPIIKLPNQGNNSIRKTTEQQSNNETKNMVDRLLENSITYKDVPAMKELLVIQKKIRSIIDEWLQYCRNALGVMEPNMYILPEFPKSRNLNTYHAYFNKIQIFKRKSKSAELKKRDGRSKTPDSIIENEGRSKSAYLNVLENIITDGKEFLETELTRSNKIKYQKDLSQRIKEFKKEMNNFKLGDQYEYHQTKRQRRKTFTLIKPSTHSQLVPPMIEEQKLLRFQRAKSFINSNLSNTEEQCPITLRYKILFDRKIDCKCKKHLVPSISDVEFDKFLRVTPSEQLIVIAVINSNEPTISRIEHSFEQLYESYTKNKVRPCLQSMKDDYRFLFYDVLTATNNSNHNQPLLIKRHNVMPGMVLMYQNGKLLFCDHIFNGYGYGLNDFLKQLHQSKNDAKAGKFLPYNFRFNRPKGPHGYRSGWGGDIGGLMLIDSNFQTKHTTTSLDSFRIKQRSFTQDSINRNLTIKKENTTISLKTPVSLPKIKQQASVEA